MIVTEIIEINKLQSNVTFIISKQANSDEKLFVIGIGTLPTVLSELQAKELACKLMEAFIMPEASPVTQAEFKKVMGIYLQTLTPVPAVKEPVKKINELDELIEGRIVHVVLSDGNGGKIHRPAIVIKVVDRGP